MKYIVYCTTNLINKKIYIGLHLTKDPLKYDHYLGCGCYDNLPSSYNKPKTHFQYAVKKYGPRNFKRIIIKVFDNLEDALALESELVNSEFLKRKDVYNEVLGGNIGDTTTAIKCYQYDLNGNFIAEYDSLQKASYAVGRGFSTIKKAIKDKTKSANYYWALTKVDKLDLSEYKTNNKYFSYEFNANYSKLKCGNIKSQKIYQYKLSGEFVKEFDSYLIAEKEFNKKGLRNAIRLGRTWQNFQWKLEKLDCIEPVEVKYSARRVGQYNLLGQLIKVYNTVTECTKHFSGCRHVLHGNRKTSGGYIFKYID